MYRLNVCLFSLALCVRPSVELQNWFTGLQCTTVWLGIELGIRMMLKQIAKQISSYTRLDYTQSTRLPKTVVWLHGSNSGSQNWPHTKCRPFSLYSAGKNLSIVNRTICSSGVTSRMEFSRFGSSEAGDVFLRHVTVSCRNEQVGHLRE